MFAKRLPVVKNRGIHLDLKGMPPTFNRLLEIIDLCSFLRINFLLFEMEDMFPWETYPMLQSKNAYSKVQMKLFYNYCKKKDIQIIPLVQSYGHMENILIRKEFKVFRERKDDPRDVCPLKGGAREVILSMIKDVINLFPDITYFHLGGDEAESLGSCPRCKRYVKKYGEAALYLEQLGPLLDYVNKQNIRPILWHDMMAKWNLKELRQLRDSVDLMVWLYDSTLWDSYLWDSKKTVKDIVDYFQKAQISLWGAGAYRYSADKIIPDIEKKAENMKDWAQKADKMYLKGLVATGWSRSETLRISNGPLENALEALCLSSKIMWDGEYELDGDMEKIRLLCSKWIRNKVIPLNEEFKNLLTYTESILYGIGKDRGLEGGPSNTFEIKNYIKKYTKAMHDFDRIEKKLLQALKGCVFSSDVKKWIRIYKESFSDRFAGIRRHIKSE